MGKRGREEEQGGGAERTEERGRGAGRRGGEEGQGGGAQLTLRRSGLGLPVAAKEVSDEAEAQLEVSGAARAASGGSVANQGNVVSGMVCVRSGRADLAVEHVAMSGMGCGCQARACRQANVVPPCFRP